MPFHVRGYHHETGIFAETVIVAETLEEARDKGREQGLAGLIVQHLDAPQTPTTPPRDSG